MISKGIKNLFVATFVVVGGFTFSGCGPDYETRIIEATVNTMQYPDTFKKVGIKIDKKNKVAYLDFTGKNDFGKEQSFRRYFMLQDENAKGGIAVPLDNIAVSTLNGFYEASPEHFNEYVKLYFELKSCQGMIRDTWMKIVEYKEDQGIYRISSAVFFNRSSKIIRYVNNFNSSVNHYKNEVRPKVPPETFRYYGLICLKDICVELDDEVYFKIKELDGGKYTFERVDEYPGIIET